ncbi:MAG: site-2 protease family protein [Pseudomonadota bacterium]
MDISFTLIAILIPCLVIAIVFHEVAHGLAAKALGDTTASDRGRLSLNPIKHVDPVGTLLVPGVLLLAGGPAFGWAKPVPVNANRLDNPRYGMMAVAAAGPGMNFVLAAIGAVALGVTAGMVGWPTGVSDSVVFTALEMFILLNVFLGLFNLLPIPPFDGSHIVGGLLPGGLRRQWYKLQRIGTVLLLGVIAASWMFGTGWIETIILPPVEWALGYYYALAGLFDGL